MICEEFFRVQGGGADETAIDILLVEKGFRIGLRFMEPPY